MHSNILSTLYIYSNSTLELCQFWEMEKTLWRLICTSLNNRNVTIIIIIIVIIIIIIIIIIMYL